MFKTNLCCRLKQWLRQESQVLMASTAVTGAIILLSLIGILQSAELAVFDQFFHLRLPEAPEQRIVLVEINENDMQPPGNWPISDQVMAQLLQKLNSYQPRAIGLDIYRDLPVEPGQSEFVKACLTIPNLIGIEKLTDKMSVGVPPHPVLSKQKQVGFNNVVIDTDGKLRRSLLYWHTNGEARQSLALKLALIYLKAEKIIPKKAKSNPDYLQLSESVFSRFKSNDGGYVRADDKGYQILVNFRRPGSFRTVSLTDVLANQVNPEWIRDRVVIIGSTAPSLQDFFYNPYSNHLLSSSATAISGVELNANFVSQIISSTLDKRPLINTLPDFLEWLWIWIWSVLVATVIWRLPSLRHTFLGLLLIGIALFIICYFTFYAGLWLPFVSTFLASIGAATVIISYRARLKEELKRSQEFLQTVINTIPDPIFVKNQEHRCIILNPAYCQFIGHPLEVLMAKTDYEIFPKQEADVFWAEDELVFQTGQAQENEAELTDAFGTTHLIATKKSLHKDAAGNVFLVGIIRDITKRKRAEQELRQVAVELTRANIELKLSEDRLRSLAYHDALTGLGNRKKFHEALNQSLTWANNNKQLVALMFLDLDGFKQVNDTLGHDTGDQLLRVVAQRLTNSLRNSDIVSRLGGDEFTVILSGIPQADYAATVAEKILKALSQVFVLEGKNAFVTVSIGISIYPKDGEVEDILIKQADLAMYRAKQLGRNQYQFANFS